MGHWFLLVLVIFQVSGGLCYSRVKSLPGFSGPLPFELETGYIGVGDLEEAQVFYYFIKSERNPETDPLLLWLNGGPRCSGLSSLLFGIGPLSFIEMLYNGSLPQLMLNPYSWTKTASMIFPDLPMETGFSYSKTSEYPKSGDFDYIRTSVQFLRKWLVREHPELLGNELYVVGSSYGGMIVPGVTEQISQENQNRDIFPYINLQGYILGNPVSIRSSHTNFAIHFAHRMDLISEELFESLETSCNGEYANIDPNNTECLRHYDEYEMCVSGLNEQCILQPNCPVPPPVELDKSNRRSLYKIHVEPGCSTYKSLLVHDWTNDDQVRRALHIREGSIGEWFRCKKEGYQYEIKSAIPYHANLSSKSHYRSLIYSGDHDMVVPSIDTQSWITSLNYSIVDDWRPWFIENQVAGYTRTYANKMTYATIKGGGHTVEFKIKESSIMFSRWITRESL